MANLKFIALIAALAIVIVGGLFLLKQSNVGQQIFTPTTKTGDLPKDETAKAEPTSGGVKSTLKEGDTVPLFKEASPTAQRLNQYVADVQAASVDGDTLSITNCTATPNAFKVTKGDSFTIRNNDDKDITLPMALGAVFTVKAKQSSTVTMNAQAAIYKYSCTQAGGSGNASSGIIEVTN